MQPVPWNSAQAAYEAQAEELLAAHRAAVPEALDRIHELHPRFLDATVPWLPRPLTREEIAAAPFDLADARLAVARGYSYADWAALAGHVAAVVTPGSPVRRFEEAVQAVIDGDIGSLGSLLDADPDLSHARSTRRTCHDPAVHAATLLHYLAANGVEGVNQRTPANAVDVARVLLERGGDPNATAGLYGGRCSVMSMLVSSAHPANRGVQVALVDLLVAFGATVDDTGTGRWTSPLATALVFGYVETAEALVRHGARWERLDLAAGLGRLDAVQGLLPSSDAEVRHRALAIAAQLGRTAVVEALLDAGEDPNRNNPDGVHARATPLHHAALGGHLATVQLLVRRGARLDTCDTLWNSTPRGWAEHEGRGDIAAWLAGVESGNGET